MAFSPLRSKALYHSRSLSLPSKLNPSTSHQFNDNLSAARGSEASCSSFSSINNRLNSLKNLFSNTDDLLQLPHIQQIILQECDEKWVDQVLDGYIRLLDACSTAKDLVSNTKQDVEELLSALRRKDVGGIHRYLNSRRKSKKTIQKSLKDLRSFKSKHDNDETIALVRTLKDTELATITVFETLLSYFSGAKVQARQSGWSLVHSKKVVSDQGEGKHENEFEKMDTLLQMGVADVHVEEITTQLKEMDSSIQDLEEELQCLFRQLIRTRVCLLNILNH